jgi:hypothetical protein
VGGEVPVVRGQTASELLDPLDRSELRAVRGQEQQLEDAPVFVQQRPQGGRVVVGGVVQDHDHSPVAAPMAQELPEEGLEARGIELRHQHAQRQREQVSLGKFQGRGRGTRDKVS